MKVVILANGAPPAQPHALRPLHEADMIVCCDGAVDKLLQLGFAPDVIAGDGDSISETCRRRFAECIHIDKDVEINDLQKSLRYCIGQKWSAATILGGSGLREDHTLANLSILLMYGKQIDLQMVTDYGIFTPIYKTTIFASRKGEQISLFSFDQNAKISTRNLLYPVNERTFSHLWEGSLNESLGSSFTIILHNPSELLVYQCLNQPQ
ncbi:MAG: thiamine diphosphokinase [Bacteroidales bacterium]|jgi:thiamine pyrophosphokinase|nr:thiamine diphosphokinase [Bacteroidales bacterium]